MNKPAYNIDPKNTLLLIVDPQKAFGVGNAPVQVPHVEAVLNNMASVIKVWLDRKGKIITTGHAYDYHAEVGRVQDFIPSIYNIMGNYGYGPCGATFHDVPNNLDFEEVSDILLRKTEFNAFIGTQLEQILHKMEVKTIIICGLTTPICVEGTVRGAHERGFQVIVLEDACASQAMGKETAEQAHLSAIGRMGYVFAEIMNTETFVQRLSA